MTEKVPQGLGRHLAMFTMTYDRSLTETSMISGADSRGASQNTTYEMIRLVRPLLRHLRFDRLLGESSALRGALTRVATMRCGKINALGQHKDDGGIGA
jgi:hypothetical protein